MYEIIPFEKVLSRLLKNGRMGVKYFHSGGPGGETQTGSHSSPLQKNFWWGFGGRSYATPGGRGDAGLEDGYSGSHSFRRRRTGGPSRRTCGGVLEGGATRRREGERRLA